MVALFDQLHNTPNTTGPTHPNVNNLSDCVPKTHLQEILTSDIQEKRVLARRERVKGGGCQVSQWVSVMSAQPRGTRNMLLLGKFLRRVNDKVSRAASAGRAKLFNHACTTGCMEARRAAIYTSTSWSTAAEHITINSKQHTSPNKHMDNAGFVSDGRAVEMEPVVSNGTPTGCSDQCLAMHRKSQNTPKKPTESPWHHWKTIFLVVTMVALTVWIIVYTVLSQMGLL
uniref:Uncharacterized protein n=1 Tax=Timema monikensis TaxID=170555 RepID=A0A7R9HU21_9NEOP|nr:unnamed protein product [Timema monikensis]